MSAPHATPLPRPSRPGQVRTIVLTPHLHFPHHNPAALAAHVRAIEAIQPDVVVSLGGLIHGTTRPATERARIIWDEQTREYAEYAKREYFQAVRDVFAGEFFALQCSDDSDSGVRGPAAGPEETSLEPAVLFDFDGFGVQSVEPETAVAPGWVPAHNHEGIADRLAPGNTAIGVARKLRRHVLCAHTHRMGLVTETWGARLEQQLKGLEVGHLVDPKHVTAPSRERGSYLQLGFALFEIDAEGNVQLQCYPMTRGGDLPALRTRYGHQRTRV